MNLNNHLARAIAIVCLAVLVSFFCAFLFVLKAHADPVANGSLAGADDLHRVLPSHSQVGSERQDRYVGIFYLTWSGEHDGADKGPFDVKTILDTYQAAHGPGTIPDFTDDAWGVGHATAQEWYYWGHPLFDYYFSQDSWVIRKHVQMLTDAGIDFLMLDATNGFTYKPVYDKLLDILEEYRLKGFKVPKIVFYTTANTVNIMRELYNDVYVDGGPTDTNYYPDLWFQWDGKPLIIGDVNNLTVPGSEDPAEPLSQEILDFFTFRVNQWPTEAQKQDGFPWMEFTRPQRIFKDSQGQNEVISVSVAQHQNTLKMSDKPFYNYGVNGDYNWGRSYHDGVHEEYDGATNWGYNVAEQWDYAIANDPKIIFITAWNEWVAFLFNYDAADSVPTPAGFAPNSVFMVDSATQEYSRDIEPMKGGHGDNYYMQMIDKIREYKGTEPLEAPGAKKTITINTDFSQWASVNPKFQDYTGDTPSRNHAAWGTTTYTNTTGRNDFDTMKVARDNSNVYFYAKTVDPITSYTDSKWMRLFIDTDGDLTNGWKGYDYVVNRSGATSTAMTIEHSTGGWNWVSDGTVSYKAVGNEIHLAVPRSILGLNNTSAPFTLQFKWSDNMQTDGDIMDFYSNGDVAPSGRLNFAYSENPLVIDQNNSTGTFSTTNSSDIRYQYRQLQQFAVSGNKLDRIDLWVYKKGAPPGDLKVDVVALDSSGNPSGAPLYSKSINPDKISTVLNPIALHPNLTVAKGGTYGVVLSSPSSPDAFLNNAYGYGYNDSNIYAGGVEKVSLNSGSTWTTVNNRSLKFATYTSNFVGTPTGLTAGISSGKVDLNWAASDNAQTYTVKRSTTPGGPYSTIASNLSSPHYADSILVNGTNYYYIVTAQNSSLGDSLPSAELPATPILNIDQDNSLGTFSTASSSDIRDKYWHLQTFTVSSASLTDVDVWLYKNGSPTGLLNFAVYAINGSNVPTGATLYQTSLSPASISGTLGKVTFHPNLTGLTPGGKYGFVLSSPSTPDAGLTNAYGYAYNDNAIYSNGVERLYDSSTGVYTTVPNRSLKFKTYGNAIVTTVDQNNSTGTFSTVSSSDIRGIYKQMQTFKVSGTTLPRLDVWMYKNGAPAGNLVLEVVTLNGSNEPNATLFSQKIDPGMISSTLNPMEIHPNLTGLTPGATYGIVLSSPGTADAGLNNAYGYGYNDSNLYGNGIERVYLGPSSGGWTTVNNRSLKFMTYR